MSIANLSVCLPLVLLTMQVTAGKREISLPGCGYPGTFVPYQASAKLKVDMTRFGMSAGWFRRNDLPAEYTRLQTPQVNELPYLLYAPKRSSKPVPMVVYFGGTGEQGTDLSAHFRQATLNDCTQNPNLRRERGFWVSLDTSGGGVYAKGVSCLGPLVGPLDTASVVLGSRPLSKLSDVAPNAQSSIYAVSSFHTHTPTTYRVGMRKSGPSQADINHSAYYNVAGIVYDYSVNNVPAGHPKESPHRNYSSQNKRILTKE